MTSNTGLYGSGSFQTTPANDTTSLYGASSGAAVPNANGDLVVRGNLAVLGGNITTTAAVGNIFNSATTVNLGAGSTAVNLGSNVSTTTVLGNLTVDGTFIAPTTSFGNLLLAPSGNPNTITTSTGNLKLNANSGVVEVDATTISTPATVAVGPAATAMTIGASTGTTTIANNLQVNGSFIAPSVSFGNVTVGQTNANTISTIAGNLKLSANTDIVEFDTNNIITNSTGLNLFNTQSGTVNAFNQAGTINIGGNASTISIGKLNSGTTTLENNVIIGDTFQVGLSPSFTVDPGTGNTVAHGDFAVNGGDITTTSTTATLYNTTATTVNIGGAATTVNIGATTGTTKVNNTLEVSNNAHNWYFNTDGTTQFPNYKFPAAAGTNTQVMAIDGSGNLYWYTPADIDTSYTFGAGSTPGGANLTLTGSDASVSTVKLTSGTGITVTDISSSEISINNAGILSVNSGGHITASTTSGAVTLGSDATSANTVSTIVARDGSGNFAANNITGNEFFGVAAQGVSNGFGIYSNDATAHMNVAASAASITNGSNNWYFNSDGSTQFPGTINMAGSIANITNTSGNLYMGAASGSDIHLDVGTYYWGFNHDGTTKFANYTFPASDGGANQVLKTNGSGVLSWYTPTSGTVTSVTGTNHISTSTVGGAVTVTSDATPSNTISTIVSRDSSGNSQFNQLTVANGVITNGILAPSGGNTGLYSNDSTAKVIVNNGQSVITNTGKNWSFNSDGSTSFPNYNFPSAIGTGNQVLTVPGVGNTLVWSTPATSITSVTGGGHITATTVSGAVTLGSDATSSNTPSTIVARDASGNFSAGTITANLANGTVALGSMEATTNPSYSFPAPPINTVSNNNGFDGASSFLNTTLGDNAGGSYIHYFADTLAGSNTAAALNFKGANGNSVAGSTVPFTGVTSVVPSALATNGIMGTVNFNGYGTTGFTDAIGSMGQGGGVSPISALQIQGVASETFADGTLTISGATITAATRTSVAFASVAVTGTKGQISFTSTSPAVGNAVVVTGTNSGTATGISAGTYYIIVTNGSTTATLSATPGGAPITTTAGTTTGLTFTRQFITVTYSAQSNIPFGLNALITVANITNVTGGTYMAMGTSTTTTVNIGAPSSGTPSLPGTQSLSTTTITNGGSFLRVRAMPPATTVNSGNRVELINHSTTAATYRADTFNISAGAYGATGANYATIGSTGGTYTGTGIVGTFIRQDTANTTNPALLLRHQRTDTSGPNDGDGVDFRLGVGGTSTSANIGRVDAAYKASTLHEIGMSTSTDSFATNTTRIFIGTADTTKIQCTPAATPTGTLQTVATFTQASTTVAVAGVNKLTVDANKVTAAVPVAFPVYTATALRAITGAVGWQACVSNSASGSNPNGMMAFWDTTNARWSYIHDNSAV